MLKFWLGGLMAQFIRLLTSLAKAEYSIKPRWYGKRAVTILFGSLLETRCRTYRVDHLCRIKPRKRVEFTKKRKVGMFVYGRLLSSNPTRTIAIIITKVAAPIAMYKSFAEIVCVVCVVGVGVDSVAALTVIAVAAPELP